MKSLKNRARSNKLNVWFILSGVGLLFVVFYYFLGKKFGLREGATKKTTNATKTKKTKTAPSSKKIDKGGSTNGDKNDYDYDVIKNSFGDFVDLAYEDHQRLLDLEYEIGPDDDVIDADDIDNK